MIKAVIFDVGGVMHAPTPNLEEEVWLRRFGNDVGRFKEMFDFVDNLKRVGVKTYAFSNTVLSHAEALKRQDIYTPFDRVFLSYEMNLRKPDPRAYHHVLRAIGLQPSEIIFVDDLEDNLVPAKNLGITTVLAKNPSQVIADVNKLLKLSHE